MLKQAARAFSGKEKPDQDKSIFELLKQFGFQGTFPTIKMKERDDSIVFEFSGDYAERDAEALKGVFEFWKLLNEGSDMQVVGKTVVASTESFDRERITNLLSIKKTDAPSLSR